MKIPKEIQKKMHRASKLYNEASSLMEEIEAYIEENYNSSNDDNSNNDELNPTQPWRFGNGISLEELEYGNDITEEFCEWAERNFEI